MTNHNLWYSLQCYKEVVFFVDPDKKHFFRKKYVWRHLCTTPRHSIFFKVDCQDEDGDELYGRLCWPHPPLPYTNQSHFGSFGFCESTAWTRNRFWVRLKKASIEYVQNACMWLKVKYLKELIKILSCPLVIRSCY